jgi:hypothetical protein
MPTGKRQVVLFSAHSPTIGGGSVILNSIIPRLKAIDIRWFYSGDSSGDDPACLRRPIMGGPILADVPRTFRLLSNRRVKGIEHVVKTLLDQPCDAYWIVSHNEGLRVAYELARRQTGRPVHVSVHDDWEHALCARSSRYRLFGALARKATIETLRKAASFDVIGEGMRAYYQRLVGRDSVVVHRYVAPERLVPPQRTSSEGASEVRAGHIGALYSLPDFLHFVAALKSYCDKAGKQCSILVVGTQFSLSDLPENIRSGVKIIPSMAEDAAARELALCDFVYAMYPLETRYKMFSETSVPTKLGTYVIASRPIFAHCPETSSLSEFIGTTGLGVLCHSLAAPEIENAIARILEMEIKPSQFEAAREAYFGQRNVERIEMALAGAVAGP